jgi:hypothetical protein
MEKKLLLGRSDMTKKQKKKPPKQTYYKVFIQKTYRNLDGYVFMSPEKAVNNSVERSFVMIYCFKKIPNLHNPMFVVKSIVGDDFKGRIKIIKHFEENHALAYAVQQDGLYRILDEQTKES